MSFINNPVLPPSSLVLVTGISGFIGSHIADQLLAAGYSVRGTTRDVAKSLWMKLLYDRKYGGGKFEVVAVPDIGQAGAFDETLKGKWPPPRCGLEANKWCTSGVCGVIHTAFDMSFQPDPNQIIPPMVSGTLNLLKAAARSQDVKRFVLTSSCAAAASPGAPCTIDRDTWNEAAIRQAWAPPPYEPVRGFTVYAASKAQCEQDAWKWYREQKPQFVLNTGKGPRNLASLPIRANAMDGQCYQA